MSKKASFFESIFEGLGPRFWMVFGRFFGSKMHAKSDLKKSVRQAKSIGKTNTKSMSEPLQQSIFRAKINEKSHVFWDIDFEWILGGFGEGFGLPKSSVFLLFASFFRCKILNATWKGLACELIEEKTRKKGRPLKSGGMCGAWGKDFLGWGEAYLSLNFKPHLGIDL